MENAIVNGEFVNFKNVQSRKAFQIVIEFPAERAMEVLRKLGNPSGHESRYVAVALLTKEAVDPLAGTPDGLAG